MISAFRLPDCFSVVSSSEFIFIPHHSFQLVLWDVLSLSSVRHTSSSVSIQYSYAPPPIFTWVVPMGSRWREAFQWVLRGGNRCKPGSERFDRVLRGGRHHTCYLTSSNS